MELKELLGEELYKQVQAKIDEKNSAETDKLKHVRYTDLSEGKYVSKEKYDSELEKLNGLITGKDTEIGNANKLIEELKKASKGDEGMQQKISTYEAENTRLQQELEETRVNSAIKVALLSAHVSDVDYVAYKLKANLKEKNTELKLDDDGNIKGWDSMLTDLKTQLPNQFESAGSNQKNILENQLQKGDPNANNSEPKTLAEILYSRLSSVYTKAETDDHIKNAVDKETQARTSAINGVKSDISSLSKKDTELSQGIDDNKNKLNAVNADIESVKASVKNLSDKHNNDINNVNESINTVVADVLKLQNVDNKYSAEFTNIAGVMSLPLLPDETKVSTIADVRKVLDPLVASLHDGFINLAKIKIESGGSIINPGDGMIGS